MKYETLSFPALRCKGINDGCCTEANPCVEGDGDCDNDKQCQGGLVCGKNNCPKKSPFVNPHGKDDCCTRPGEDRYVCLVRILTDVRKMSKKTHTPYHEEIQLIQVSLP